jgi:tetratricopeptide (TPR) repeat protein
VLDSTKLLVDFQKAVSDAAKNHEDFLEKLTDRQQSFFEYCLKFLGFVGGGVSIFLAFFGFNTLKQFKSALKKKADEEIAAATAVIDDEVEKFKKIANANSEKISTLAKEIDKHVLIKRRLDQANFCIATHPNDLSYTAHLTQAVASAEKCIVEEPTHAPASAIKGLALIRLDKKQDAIDALDTCLKSRRDAGIAPDKEDGNLFYNLACYQNMLADQYINVGKTGEAEDLKKKAWENLKKDVVELNPEDLPAAKVDKQLESIISGNRKWHTLEPKTTGSGSTTITP